MPLQISTPQDIVNRIQLRVAGRIVPLTDLLPISVARILIEEMIVPEYAALWAGLLQAQRDWFIGTAEGTALDRRLADYGLTRPGGTTAYGLVQVELSAATVILQGTLFSTSPSDTATPVKQYSARAEVQGVTGWNTVEVVSQASGTAGNTGRHTITATSGGIANLVSITNPSPIVNGTDPVDDAGYRQYFRDWLRSLTRGTRGALLFGIKTYVDPAGRRVHSAALEEWTGAGMLPGGKALRIFVDEGLGGTAGAATASDALVSSVQQLVEGDDGGPTAGLRAAGVPTAVEAALALPVPVSATIDVDGATSVTATTRGVQDAIDRHFGALSVSGVRATGEVQGQFSLARLFAAISDVPGVLRVVMDTPSTDLPVPVGYKAVPGTVTLYPRVVT